MDHYVKGHLANGLLSAIMAKYAPEMRRLRAVDAVRIGWFLLRKRASRQTVANVKSVPIPASQSASLTSGRDET